MEKSLSMQKKMSLNQFFRQFGIVIVLILMCIVISCLTDRFFTISNILSVARQVSINGILALGMGFVIITGGIDLSVGSLLALTASITLGLIGSGVNWFVGCICGMLVGIAVGLLEGLLVAKLRIAPFIATLASMTICRGATQVFDGGTAIRVSDVSFKALGQNYIGPIPVPVIIMIVMFIIGWFITKKTRFGRHMYAVGGNEQAARLSGVSVPTIKISVYCICGLCCAVSGFITAARLGSATPTAGEGAEMDAIAAVVLGGVSMDGGKGSLTGVFVGAFIIGVLNNALNLLSVSAYWQEIAKGLVILLAVVIDRVLSKEKA